MSEGSDWSTIAWRLEELARDLGDATDVDDTLRGALRLAIEFTPCDVASVEMHRDHDIETMAASDPVAEKAHELQLEFGEGPCLQVKWDDEGVNVVTKIADEQRWPRWAHEAQKLGLESLLAVRLFTRQGTVGALDLYSHERRDYHFDDILTARIVAARVSAAIASARREENLWAAVDSRHSIGIAQGILMERYGINADQAFGVLRRYSQESNQKLRSIAQGVIDHRRLPDDGLKSPGQ